MAKPKVAYWDDGAEIITETPSRAAVRYKLQDGNVLMIWFKRYRNRGEVSKEILYVWTVAMCVAPSKQWGRYWHSRGGQNAITGTGGLEGLMMALKYVRIFAEQKLSAREALQVKWADERRKRVYSRLTRYEGWSMQYRDGREVCIEYRDPDYWIDLSKGEQTNV